jgi:hypothetical protein
MQTPTGVGIDAPGRNTSAYLSPVEQTDLDTAGWVRYAPGIVGVVLVLLAGGLYVLTLAPSVMPGDYAEFQFSAAILGVPHPTGYPLYILLGKLFTMLPVGDVAYRVNLSSAVYMAGAVGMLYAVSLRLLRLCGLGRLWWAAGVGAALFAVAPTPWSMALVARSYALNALLVGSVVYCLISWRVTAKSGWFYAACLLIGLSMVHHGTTYLLLPAYGLYLLAVEVGLGRPRGTAEGGVSVNPAGSGRWKRLTLGVVAFLLGYSPILFLVYRFVWGSPYYWGSPTTWKDFFNLLTGGPFQNQVFGFGMDVGTQLERVAFGISELSGQYTPVGILLGVVGLVALWRLRRLEAVLLTLMMLGNFLFAMNYSLVGYLYFIPTFLLWGIFMAVGVGVIAHAVIAQVPAAVTARVVPTVAAVVVIGAVLYAVTVRYAGIDQSGQTMYRDTALAMLNTAPENASIYLDWEELSVLRFYRLVYGMRRDITLHSGDPSDWPEAVYCDLAAGFPPFVGKFAGALPTGVERDFVLQPAPMGWRVTDVRNPQLYAVPPCGTCATCR